MKKVWGSKGGRDKGHEICKDITYGIRQLHKITSNHS